VQIETGRPNKVVDGRGGGCLVSPASCLLWDRRVNNHKVTDHTVASTAEYLEQNHLQDVCVRGQPVCARCGMATAHAEQGRRLPVWRYTLGTLSLVGYTIFPRSPPLGGDVYNPYHEFVVRLLRLSPALVAMQSAAYAKDIHRRDYPGDLRRGE